MQNRKARHNYFIDETLEAGVVLTGTEVKSLREGRANIGESFATVKGDEIFLVNAHISEYGAGNRFNHAPARPRKLLLRKREIRRLIGALQREGVTLVPLAIYFTERGIAINPRRRDLLEATRGSNLPIRPIEDIRAEVEAMCGGPPAPPDFGEKIVAAIKWVDGTVIDCVREVALRPAPT